jgi:hypothetical protein
MKDGTFPMMRKVSMSVEPEIYRPETPVKGRSLYHLIAQAVLFLMGAAVTIYSYGLGLTTSLGPGPGMFPIILGILLMLLPAIWVFQERREPTESTEVPENSHLVAVFVSLVLVAAALDYLGFQFSMFVFAMYHLKVRARRGWWLSLLLSLVASVGAFQLFTNVLNVALPTASLPPFSWIGL